jgi:hypothetical protein
LVIITNKTTKGLVIFGPFPSRSRHKYKMRFNIIRPTKVMHYIM